MFYQINTNEHLICTKFDTPFIKNKNRYLAWGYKWICNGNAICLVEKNLVETLKYYLNYSRTLEEILENDECICVEPINIALIKVLII
jgi:hypothetical protein